MFVILFRFGYPRLRLDVVLPREKEKGGLPMGSHSSQGPRMEKFQQNWINYVMLGRPCHVKSNYSMIRQRGLIQNYLGSTSPRILPATLSPDKTANIGALSAL